MKSYSCFYCIYCKKNQKKNHNCKKFIEKKETEDLLFQCTETEDLSQSTETKNKFLFNEQEYDSFEIDDKMIEDETNENKKKEDEYINKLINYYNFVIDSIQKSMIPNIKKDEIYNNLKKIISISNKLKEENIIKFLKKNETTQYKLDNNIFKDFYFEVFTYLFY